jgi:hypothetical protein
MLVDQNVFTGIQWKNSVPVYSVLSSGRQTCYVALKLQNISHYFSHRKENKTNKRKKPQKN